MPRFPKIINDDGSYRYPVSPGDLAQNEIDDDETAEWDEEDFDDEEDDEEDDPYGVNRLRNIGRPPVQRNPLTAIHARTRPAPLFDTNLDNEDDIQRWEDGDSYPIPPTNMRDARDDYGGAPREYDDNAPAGNPQDEFDLGKPRTAAERYEAALNAKTSHESQMPRESEHKPKAWQRALAGVANFGAGYVNAGGRVRVDPGAMQNINQSLLRPGYQRDVQKWKEQGVGINSEIDAAGRAVQLESQKQRAELEARRAAAYEKAQGSQESYNRRREAKLDEPVWHQSNTGHVIWRENEDGSIRKEQIEAPKTPPPVKETNAEAVTRRWEEVKDDPDLTPEQKKTYKLTGRVPVKPRPVGVGKGGSGKPRKGTPGQMSTLQKDITKEYASAEAAALKELAAAGLTGFDVNNPWKWNDEASKIKIKGIEKRLVDRKNQIEKAYNARGSALGGEVRDGVDPAYSVLEPKVGGVVVTRADAPATKSPSGPKIGEERIHNGGTYRFDGKQWVLK